MGSVTTTFEPGPGNTIRFRTRFEDDDRMVGHSQSDMEPQAEVFGIAWVEFIAAGCGIITQFEGQPAIMLPPTWVGVLVEAMNPCLDQLDVKLNSLEDNEDQIDKILIKMKKNAVELERLDAALNLLLDETTNRIPGLEN